jgi:hypothetical protein
MSTATKAPDARAVPELPSREFLEDGTKNPDYDPTLDPSSKAWRPARYFALRPQVRVLVKGDPENPDDRYVQASINGHARIFAADEAHEMPIDFAQLLVSLNSKRIVSRADDFMGLAITDKNGENRPIVIEHRVAQAMG